VTVTFLPFERSTLPVLSVLLPLAPVVLLGAQPVFAPCVLVLPVAKLCHGEWSAVLVALYQLIDLGFHLFHQFCFQLLRFHAPYSLPLLVNAPH